jgi:hypothetical protein
MRSGDRLNTYDCDDIRVSFISFVLYKYAMGWLRYVCRVGLQATAAAWWTRAKAKPSSDDGVVQFGRRSDVVDLGSSEAFKRQ